MVLLAGTRSLQDMDPALLADYPLQLLSCPGVVPFVPILARHSVKDWPQKYRNFDHGMGLY